MPSVPTFLDFFFLGDPGLSDGKNLYVFCALALKKYPFFGYKKNKDILFLASEKLAHSFRQGQSYRAPILVANKVFQRWPGEEPLLLPELGKPSPLDVKPDLRMAVESGASLLHLMRVWNGSPKLSYPELLEAAEKMLGIKHEDLAAQTPRQSLRAPRELGKPTRRPKGKGRPYDMSF